MRNRHSVQARTGDFSPDSSSSSATLTPAPRIEYSLPCWQRVCFALLLVVGIATLVLSSVAVYYSSASNALVRARYMPNGTALR